MPRRADPENIERLERVIESHPGNKPGLIARHLGWPREKVARGLVTLNDRGVLIYEDEKGRLWKYSERES